MLQRSTVVEGEDSTAAACCRSQRWYVSVRERERGRRSDALGCDAALFCTAIRAAARSAARLSELSLSAASPSGLSVVRSDVALLGSVTVDVDVDVGEEQEEDEKVRASETVSCGSATVW